MTVSNAKENVIQIKNVHWNRERQPILDDISWDVRKGEHWAIVGLNGSGKTSLLNIITGYQWPSSGEVHVLGEQLGGVDLRELRKSIGWVSNSLGERYQGRPRDTAYEVVISGKFASIGLYEEFSTKDKETALELLRSFQVGHVTDKPYFTLSQGEKQKVMLARAWMANPKLIILDEPCTGLDISAREELLSTIQKLATIPEGPTLLYVTHHIEEIVPMFTHALLLKDGHIVAAGEKESVFTSSLLEKTLKLPVSVRWENNRPWVSVSATANY
jgi:iron complex transport system ATP-binding protein